MSDDRGKIKIDPPKLNELHEDDVLRQKIEGETEINESDELETFDTEDSAFEENVDDELDDSKKGKKAKEKKEAKQRRRNRERAQRVAFQAEQEAERRLEVRKGNQPDDHRDLASQKKASAGNEFTHNQIKPHEKFMHQPLGDDNRLSQQTANNPNAEEQAEKDPRNTPSPSARLQAQAVNAATPKMQGPTPTG